MSLSPLPVTISLYFFLRHLTIPVAGALYYPLDNIAVNCGFSGNSTAADGRQWIGDNGSKYITSHGSKGKLISSIAVDQLLSPDPVPYKTARISRSQFTYTFQVSPGVKFIRLHFYPTSYRGFKRSKAFFTVKFGPYTLLSNFSAALTSDALGLPSFAKEFCANVEENQRLIISFTPSQCSSTDEVYAFVNGIEVISMPTGLYHTLEGEEGVHVVGKKHQFSIDKNIALEKAYRLNVGGSSILFLQDTGMFREWSEDSNYLLESSVLPASTTSRIKYTNIPAYIAPQKVYQTSWSIVPDNQANKTFNFTWKLPVDSGFRYLLRFHFCELEYEIKESGNTGFSIFVNEEVAEAKADIIEWSGRNGVAVYRDYMVMMEGDRMEGKRDLIIALCPHKIDNYDWTEQIDAILKGLEVFKLSNHDKNLAGVNPEPLVRASTSGKPNPRKLAFASSRNAIATGVVVLLTVANIIVYNLHLMIEKVEKKYLSSLQYEGLCRRFSLSEILSVTKNFNDELVIGRGGFGKVYKAVIDGGETSVAIKRLNLKSSQGADEFWTEIEMLSNLRHTHLVSLIGYCDERSEMILVYDYMEYGTLADHLYKINIDGTVTSLCHLSWEQRVNICIGAARGLDYLHTGTRHGIIHRDVKSTNILLDKDWISKISDFGLCKTGSTSHSCTHVSTDVKGTFGYLDPEYFLTRRLTKKSDVYAFGVVMLEVLCGRPSVVSGINEDQRSLVLWAQQCMKEKTLDQIIHPILRDQITPKRLMLFAEVAIKCLHSRPNGRPTMADVVASLVCALAFDENLRVYSFSDLKSATKGFKQEVILGVGGFGSVYKGWVDETTLSPSRFGSGMIVAIKRLNHESVQDFKEWQSKVDFLRCLSHPNLVKLLGYCFEDQELLLVYEFMQRGSLKNHLFRSGGSATDTLSWDLRLKIAIDSAKGLAFLHTSEKQVIHRDFKASNILLDESYNAKISDFGLAKVGPTGENTHVSTRIMGTREYAAPEYIATGHLYVKSDVYSFGVVLLEMMSGLRAIDYNRPREQINLIKWAEPLLPQKRGLKLVMDARIEGQYSSKAATLTAKLTLHCLKLYPSNRPSMKEVVEVLEKIKATK
ncbi:receptor-like protein kinase FERONIA [Actinidia eriantha]|uniref:receptor-like protein kinase FERONIA n=1 Tax=Actinidia eriantha TaxID=165200 RepID=UPI00258A446B|nr:receptor-like protein kinase FERONIA [Actinidia eriantha]